MDGSDARGTTSEWRARRRRRSGSCGCGSLEVDRAFRCSRARRARRSRCATRSRFRSRSPPRVTRSSPTAARSDSGRRRDDAASRARRTRSLLPIEMEHGAACSARPESRESPAGRSTVGCQGSSSRSGCRRGDVVGSAGSFRAASRCDERRAGASTGRACASVRDGPVAPGRSVPGRRSRNAFDEMLDRGADARRFCAFRDDRDIRVVILEGDGPSFCAGADIAWMRRAGGYSQARRTRRTPSGWPRCSERWTRAPGRSWRRSRGRRSVAASASSPRRTSAIAAGTTVFSLAEVKLGILPSVISPFVLRAIGRARPAAIS